MARLLFQWPVVRLKRIGVMIPFASAPRGRQIAAGRRRRSEAALRWRSATDMITFLLDDAIGCRNADDNLHFPWGSGIVVGGPSEWEFASISAAASRRRLDGTTTTIRRQSGSGNRDWRQAASGPWGGSIRAIFPTLSIRAV